MLRFLPCYHQLVLLAAVLGIASGCQSSRWQQPEWTAPIALEPLLPTSVREAEAAYTSGLQLEASCDEHCVDAYYEAAKLCWTEIGNSLQNAQCRSERAWCLYHSSLAKLVCTGEKYRRFDSNQRLRIRGPDGEQFVPVNYHAFLWRPEDFNEFIPVGNYSSSVLNNSYRSPGLGFPLVVKRKRCFDEPMLQREQVFAATVVLQPTNLSADEGVSFSLDFYDPLRCHCIEQGTCLIPLCRDLSAPYGYLASNNNNRYLEAFLMPGSADEPTGLYAIEPHQPGKIPLILVHGLLSDSSTWLAMMNELQARPEIRQRYQIWAFQYATGNAFTRSARKLREEIENAIQSFDPHRLDPAMSNMVIVGHSMGGLVAKLQVTSSRTQIWNSFANRPVDQIFATSEMRSDLASSSFFEPQTAIKRVVFIATPHRGAGVAQRIVGRIAATLVREPENLERRHRYLITKNPGVFSQEVQNHIPTSIDLLKPKSCILQAIECLPFHEDVKLHSIIGDDGKLIGEKSDCVVPVSSARHPGVLSERFINAKHITIQRNPETIEEVINILRLHAAEAETQITARPMINSMTTN